ncbi:MAG: glycosyltransferase [Paracoccaceae bacterium]
MILLDAGVLDRPALAEALRRQRRSGARLGEVLRANGLVSAEAVETALAVQSGLSRADPVAEPPDPMLATAARLPAMLERRALPWRRDAAGRVLVASPDPARLSRDLPGLARALGLTGEEIVPAACGPRRFEAALLALHPEARAARAAGRTPARLSARGLAAAGPRATLGACLGALCLAAAAAPGAVLPALFLAALALNMVNVAMRLAALLAPAPRPPAAPALRRDPSAAERLPSVSILVALHREPAVVADLIEGLTALDWPLERLEVLLALEADDAETAAAVAAARPPPWIRVIPTPPGAPRTKPRALNHALDFARGTIVGVYDAEDRPEPDQIRRAAAALATAPARLACVQARLGIYNVADGWMPRLFALDYAVWFRLVLPALMRLGAPPTLSGTSFFIRRRVLERLGGWDAWNVTEDADLGIRLARAGYRVGPIDSETSEEAVRGPLAWLRQRSRWQKGFLMTWLVHMRAPGRLRRDLGWRGFLGFQVLFLGAAAASLGLPLLLAGWIWWGALGAPGLGAAPVWLATAALAALHLGQAVTVGSAVLAARRAGRPELARWAPLLPFYAALGTLSALKALGEAVAAPAFWDKTAHGLSRRGVAETETSRSLRKPLRPITTP